MLRPRARSTRRRRRGLGPNHHKLATAAAVSNLGDGVYLAALPLLAARLTRDPLRVSAVTAAGWLPWLLFGLVSGALVDRVFMAGQAILVLFAQEVLGLGGVGYGLLAAFAVGGLPGSLLCARWSSQTGSWGECSARHGSSVWRDPVRGPPRRCRGAGKKRATKCHVAQGT